jgi:hypothetical protein
MPPHWPVQVNTLETDATQSDAFLAILIAIGRRPQTTLAAESAVFKFYQVTVFSIS